MQTTMETIAAGAAPVSAANSSVNQPVANKRARYTAGQALASVLCDELQKQAGTLKHYIQSLTELDKDGREGFVAFISEITKARAGIVKDNGGKGSLHAITNTSASVRLSEFRKLAQAIDKGFKPDMGHSYHAIVAAARLFVGKDTRGRAKSPAIVKLYRYMGSASAKETVDDDDAAAMQAVLEVLVQQLEKLGLVE